MYLHKYEHGETHGQGNGGPAARPESNTHADPVINIEAADAADEIEKCGEHETEQYVVHRDSQESSPPGGIAPSRRCATLKSVKQPAREEPAHHDGGDRRERSGYEDSHQSQLCPPQLSGNGRLKQKEMIFRARAHRFHFRAVERLRFSGDRAGNTIRGFLGTGLAEQIFRPRSHAGPSGFADPPRPFILRASHLNGSAFAPGDAFHIDVHTFDPEGNIAAEIARGFAAAPRSNFELEEVVMRGDFSIDLASPEPASSLVVRFLTATELKGAAAEDPAAFSMLFARIRDRVATLRRYYGAGPLEADFRGLGERAKNIRTVRANLRQRRIFRRSSRTGEVHGIGGFEGAAEYAGDLAEFAPWLRAACWTGVGRHTVWGNGEIECVFGS